MDRQGVHIKSMDVKRERREYESEKGAKWFENDCKRELKERIEHIESFTPSHGYCAEL